MNNLILLFHCISSYPTPTNQSNLNNISFLANQFDCEVGLSDHSISNLASTLSIGLGAVAIEKHFNLDTKTKSVDECFSLLPKEFSSLVRDCNEAWLAIGGKKFKRSILEEKNKKYEERKSKQEKYPPARHPVIRTHPETGERGIYTNQPFVSHIEGISEEESRRLLNCLQQAILDPSVQCRIKWAVNTIVMWDNRIVQHQASNDFYPQTRHVERVTIIGTKPV